MPLLDWKVKQLLCSCTLYTGTGCTPADAGVDGDSGGFSVPVPDTGPGPAPADDGVGGDSGGYSVPVTDTGNGRSPADAGVGGDNGGYLVHVPDTGTDPPQLMLHAWREQGKWRLLCSRT